MRLVCSLILAVPLVLSTLVAPPAGQLDMAQYEAKDRGKKDGRQIFRYDTFGDEQLWTGVLRMHEVIATVPSGDRAGGWPQGGCGGLPWNLIAALRLGKVDLTDPAVTVDLLRLNAVVGVRGTVSDTGQLTSVGITCALCHSSVDNSFAPGIGRRLDGWANTDLNVGAIVALSPALDAATKAEFNAWGPGKYDPRHHAFDGTNLLAAEQSLAADCASADLWIEGSRLRDVHRRRTYFVLEQLRRRWADGRARQLPRSGVSGCSSRRRRIS